jgi:hypothetical protein
VVVAYVKKPAGAENAEKNVLPGLLMRYLSDLFFKLCKTEKMGENGNVSGLFLDLVVPL